MRTLIGSSGLHAIGGEHFKSAISGSMIFRPEYWGMGIVKHCHRARTWCAFEQLGVVQLRSAVMSGNEASLRALKASGYEEVGVERNFGFVDGHFVHHHNLECINPVPRFWSAWWGNDAAPQGFVRARQRTRASLKWSKQQVKLL